MLSFLRLLISLISLGIAWAITVLSFLAGTWYMWHAVSGIDLSVATLPAPPSLIDFLALPLWLAMVLFVFYFAVFTLTPMGYSLKQMFLSVPLEKLSYQHSLSQLVSNIARKMDVRPPSVFVVSMAQANAFAFSTLFKSSITLSTSLLERLDREELEWVVAHELSHIRHLDAMSGGFWIAAMVVMNIAVKLQYWAVRVITACANTWFMPVVLTVLILLPVYSIAYVSRLLSWVARCIFKLIDKVIGRAMEYRADREAACYINREAGVRVLTKMEQGLEPYFDRLFASHPTTQRRISNIEKSPCPAIHHSSAT